MRRGKIIAIMLLCFSVMLTGCNIPGTNPQENESQQDEPVWLNMNKEFPNTQSLPDGQGKKAFPIF